MMYNCRKASPHAFHIIAFHLFERKAHREHLSVSKCTSAMQSLTTAVSCISTSFRSAGFQLRMYAQPVDVSSSCSNRPGKLFAFKQNKQKLLWLYADNTSWEKLLSTRTSYCSVVRINSFKSNQLH